MLLPSISCLSSVCAEDIGGNQSNARGLFKNKIKKLSFFFFVWPVYCRLEAAWNLEQKKKKPSLAKALVKAFGPTFAVAAAFKLVYDTLLFVGPMLLNRLITFLGDKDAPDSDGYKYLMMLFVRWDSIHWEDSIRFGIKRFSSLYIYMYIYFFFLCTVPWSVLLRCTNISIVPSVPVWGSSPLSPPWSTESRSRYVLLFHFT